MGEKINVAIIGAGIVGTTLRFGVKSFCFLNKSKYIFFLFFNRLEAMNYQKTSASV